MKSITKSWASLMACATFQGANFLSLPHTGLINDHFTYRLWGWIMFTDVRLPPSSKNDLVYLLRVQVREFHILSIQPRNNLLLFMFPWGLHSPDHPLSLPSLAEVTYSHWQTKFFFPSSKKNKKKSVLV